MPRLILCLWAALLWSAGLLPAAEVLPAKPPHYFNDFAGVVSPATAAKLDAQLVEFERATSNQILVAVYPKLETASSLQDYTFRIAESWRVGQAKRDNGAVLFVFIDARKMFIQVGYGLEGALPDITCKQIIENEIKPAFKTGNYDAGLTAGVESMIKATKGEYKGTGRVAGDQNDTDQSGLVTVILAGVFLLMFVVTRFFRRSGTTYDRFGKRTVGGGGGGGWWLPPMGGGGFGGGGGGGGGGGFSGGGGSFGGGGAGGNW